MKPSSAAIPLAVVLTCAVAGGSGRAQSVSTGQAAPATFDHDVRPILDEVCTRCHNEKKANAGLNLGPFMNPSTIATKRETWELVVDKLKAGDMPPADEEPLSTRERAAMVSALESSFAREDRDMKPDPGHVPVHRLTRAEYANTIRDLLGIDFRATDEFPPDDTGYGFDNIGDVLTVSPVLMQRYLAAAEKIAARAVGGGPLPSPGVFTRRNRVRRIADGTIQLKDVVDYDADYAIRVGVTGHRGADDPPVTMDITVDGATVKTVSVPVQLSAVNKQGGGTQRVVYEARVFLPGNEHTFRAAFIGDETLQSIPAKSRGDATQNIFPEFIDVAGPFKPAERHVVKKKALICDPATGAACAHRIIATVAHRAYRRPVAPADLAPLNRVYAAAAAHGYQPGESLKFAIAAILVSPNFLFRVEQDRMPEANGAYRLDDYEVASRLSYFLW
ncbi:MAG TPA: DUF1587 domain-containing protein, partial [Vicinamibacterales bacterium]